MHSSFITSRFRLGVPAALFALLIDSVSACTAHCGAIPAAPKPTHCIVKNLSAGDVFLRFGTAWTVAQDWHGPRGIELRCLPGAHLFTHLHDGFGTNLDVLALGEPEERVHLLFRTAPALTPNEAQGLALVDTREYSTLHAVAVAELPAEFVYITERGQACFAQAGVLKGLDPESLLATDETALGRTVESELADRDLAFPTIPILLTG